ncbi:MAG: hypothetical protein E6K15_08265 [Methanobacteriota archaeon]|nr:MAG: hypothetical protein E6K15_08265 [Euryarchaeota archaeon]
MPGEEEVNFERVTKVYREESGKKTLVNLEADFYDKLAAYVAFGPVPQKAEPTPGDQAPHSKAPPPTKEPERMRVVRSEDTKRIAVAPTLKDHVLVHVLEDIPPFAGIDTTYRLKREDVVTLPKTIAQILVDRGKARIVQVAGPPA